MGSPTQSKEDDVGLIETAVHPPDAVGVIALDGLEVTIVDAGRDEADVAVVAEVVAEAPVVRHDVARARLLGPDHLESRGALAGGADPIADGRPVARRHPVPGALEGPCHEARAPRLAGRARRRLEPFDLG